MPPAALAALLLATVGVYGVVGDAVRRRTPEIGLRVALGAPSWQILRLVFSEGLPLTVAGSAAGLVAALLLARLLRSFVHAVPALDLASLASRPGGAAARRARRGGAADPQSPARQPHDRAPG